MIWELPSLGSERQGLAYAGIRLGKGELTPKIVHEALETLGDRPDRWIYEMLALRAMTQAVYSPANKGHFGLALERCMHFTSPIRRYADLVVHRAIKATLHGTDARMTDDWLVATGEHISTAERRAESVAWGVEGWLKCEYVATRIEFQMALFSLFGLGFDFPLKDLVSFLDRSLLVNNGAQRLDHGHGMIILPDVSSQIDSNGTFLHAIMDKLQDL